MWKAEEGLGRYTRAVIRHEIAELQADLQALRTGFQAVRDIGTPRCE